jgi:ribosome recycling factor
MALVDDAKKEMQAALRHFAEELKTIRSGRASPAMLDHIQVEVYGSQMRLSDIGNVTAPEARQLLVTPYDASNVGAIAKAIDRANLSVKVVAEGNVVRITIPPMDEQTRKEMVKQCHRKCEDGKVAIRNVRRKFNDQARKRKSDGDISEDELKRAEKKIQELTDDFCRQADEAGSKKEKEILTV